jgi:1,4-alpha-glucan branching enzyme
MWLQGNNDWIYRHLHMASERMTELARGFRNVDGLLRRALNQALRELLLAQSSDWAFIMGTGTHTSYAVRRTKDHLLRFNRLYEEIKTNCIDSDFLSDIEYKDNIFPNIDYSVHQ